MVYDNITCDTLKLLHTNCYVRLQINGAMVGGSHKGAECLLLHFVTMKKVTSVSSAD